MPWSDHPRREFDEIASYLRSDALPRPRHDWFTDHEHRWVFVERHRTEVADGEHVYDRYRCDCGAIQDERVPSADGG